MASLLSLPRELRDLTYSFLLRPTFTDRNTYLLWGTGFEYTFPLSVLLLNRQINNEATQALYGDNVFALNIDYTSPVVANSLRAIMASSIRPWVRKFVIRVVMGIPYLPPFDSVEAISIETARILVHTFTLLADGSPIESLHLYYSYEGSSRDTDEKVWQRFTAAFSPLYGHVHDFTISRCSGVWLPSELRGLDTLKEKLCPSAARAVEHVVEPSPTHT